MVHGKILKSWPKDRSNARVLRKGKRSGPLVRARQIQRLGFKTEEEDELHLQPPAPANLQGSGTVVAPLELKNIIKT
jgi:hypothetical protein